MPQLAGRPVRRVEARSREDDAERAADIPRVERGTDLGGEHQVAIVPPVPYPLAELVLTVTVETERVGAALR